MPLVSNYPGCSHVSPTARVWRMGWMQRTSFVACLLYLYNDRWSCFLSSQFTFFFNPMTTFVTYTYVFNVNHMLMNPLKCLRFSQIKQIPKFFKTYWTGSFLQIYSHKTVWLKIPHHLFHIHYYLYIQIPPNFPYHPSWLNQPALQLHNMIYDKIKSMKLSSVNYVTTVCLNWFKPNEIKELAEIKMRQI